MKKLFCFLLIFPVVICFYLPCFASSANNGFYVDGFYTLEKSGFPDTPYYQPLSSPIVDNNLNIPSNYTLIGYVMDTGLSSSLFPYSVEYLYGDASQSWKFYSSGSSITFSCQNSNLYYVVNTLLSDGSRTFSRYRTEGGNYTSGRLIRFTTFIDTVDNNGNINRPESSVNFTLNTFIRYDSFNLQFNCNLNSGDGSIVDYYIFPSSANIPTGSTSVIIPKTPSSELLNNDKQTILERGFRFLETGPDDLIDRIEPYSVSLSESSSSFGTSLFEPSSYGVPFSKLGSQRLYMLNGTGSTPSATLSLKDMISTKSGVYLYDSLQLVAVCNFDNRSFIATYPFNPSLIVGGSPVPPTTTEGSVSFPTFGDDTSQFKDLADYLKDLFNTNQENIVRNNNNLLANLMAMPWSNFVGTGFGSQLPNLSFYLDSLFDSLFDKYTAPTEDQINALYEDIQVERNSIKAKLAFASDVKAELYFIISTITADNNSVPPRFEINLPSSLFGGHQVRTVDLMSYEIATPYVVGIIKDFITVFLSLGLVLHVWRTLPSTIGNMPRGDE